MQALARRAGGDARRWSDATSAWPACARLPSSPRRCGFPLGDARRRRSSVRSGRSASPAGLQAEKVRFETFDILSDAEVPPLPPFFFLALRRRSTPSGKSVAASSAALASSAPEPERRPGRGSSLVRALRRFRCGVPSRTRHSRAPPGSAPAPLPSARPRGAFHGARTRSVPASAAQRDPRARGGGGDGGDGGVAAIIAAASSGLGASRALAGSRNPPRSSPPPPPTAPRPWRRRPPATLAPLFRRRSRRRPPPPWPISCSAQSADGGPARRPRARSSRSGSGAYLLLEALLDPVQVEVLRALAEVLRHATAGFPTPSASALLGRVGSPPTLSGGSSFSSSFAPPAFARAAGRRRRAPTRGTRGTRRVRGGAVARVAESLVVHEERLERLRRARFAPPLHRVPRARVPHALASSTRSTRRPAP